MGCMRPGRPQAANKIQILAELDALFPRCVYATSGRAAHLQIPADDVAALAQSLEPCLRTLGNLCGSEYSDASNRLLCNGLRRKQDRAHRERAQQAPSPHGSPRLS